MKQLKAYPIICTLVAVYILSLFGCGDPDNSTSEVQQELSDGRYTIVCTIGMITDVVRVVAGDHAKVEGIIGEGIDPHLYKPTRSDVIVLDQADVVFYNGLLLEGKMSAVLEKIAVTGKPVKAVAEMILEDADYLLEKDDKAGHTDPHVWMDVQVWIKVAMVIAETLSDFDPNNQAEYTSNARGYIKKLEALDTYARESIVSIPESQRVLVTAHDAFSYLGRATGLEVRGIQGLSTESEAGLSDIEALIQFIVEQKIPAIFVETSVSDKNVRALVEGATAQGHPLRIGGTLFSDAMGQAGTYEGTYIGMIDHNITTIVRALGGKAPEAGMQGRLKNVSH